MCAGKGSLRRARSPARLRLLGSEQKDDAERKDADDGAKDEEGGGGGGTAGDADVPDPLADDMGGDDMGFGGDEYLGPIHIHALANVLRRPVVLMSAPQHWEAALAGVYLPARLGPIRWTADLKTTVIKAAKGVARAIETADAAVPPELAEDIMKLLADIEAQEVSHVCCCST